MSRATGQAPSASRRVSSSVCAVIRMTGSLHPEAASVSHNFTPFISGRSISTTRHASAFGKSLFSSVLGRSKVRTSKPAPVTSLRKARSIDGSSSITMMIGFCVIRSVIRSPNDCTQRLLAISDHSLTTSARMRYKNRQRLRSQSKRVRRAHGGESDQSLIYRERDAEEEWSMFNPGKGVES